MQRRLALISALALVATALWATIFWARLPGRIPTEADYRQANALIASHLQPGDIIVLAPAWAEAGRPFLTAASVNAGYDLAHDDYPGTKRQWLVALADVPHFDLQKARAKLLARGPSAGPGVRIGQLWVEPFAILGSPETYSFMDQVDRAKVTITSPGRPPELCRQSGADTHQCSRGAWNHVGPGWYEIKEHPVHCLWAQPVDGGELRIEYPDVPLHGHVRGWGALVGDAPDMHGAPVDVHVEVDGRSILATQFPNAYGKHSFEAAMPASLPDKGTVTFVVTTPNAFRRDFCFNAWMGP